jgi:hypothetical protein
MKQLVFEKIIISANPPSDKRSLWLRGNGFYYWYRNMWRLIDSNVDIDESYIDEKVTEVVSETIGEEINKVVGNAPVEYDTLGEVVEYIKEHSAEADVRDEQIEENASAIKDLNEKFTTIDPTGSGWNEVL